MGTKISFKGFIYETYSRENSELLKYAKNEDSYDMDNLRYLFRDWLSDTHPDLMKDFVDLDDMDFSELSEKYGQYFGEFKKALDRGAYRDEPEVYADTKRNLTLMKQQVLPNDTWLVHFSDNAYNIVKEGFTIGAPDITKLGITKNEYNDMTEPGYNFAFLADSRDALYVANTRTNARKYGKEIVMFRGSGVHFHHYGDEEDQIVFYGPDVKGLVYIADEGGDYCVCGNASYKAKDYLFVPNDRISESSYTQCINWVEKNWRQYANVLFWNPSNN